MTDATGTSFQEKPMVETFAPARYPAPDWTRLAEVRECWLPKEVVGWMVIQDDQALSWLSSAGPDRPAAQAVNIIIQDSLKIALEEGDTPREAWNRCAGLALWRGPEDMSLVTLSKRIQEAWA